MHCVEQLKCLLVLTRHHQTIPLFVQHHFGWGTGAAGGVLFALVGPNVLGPGLGRLSEKWGPRGICLASAMGMAGALAALGAMTADEGAIKGVFVLLVAVIGACIVGIQTPLMVAIVSVSKENGRDATGQAYGLMSSSYAAGILVGPVWAAGVMSFGGWMGLCVSLSLLSVVTAGVVFVAFQPRTRVDAGAEEA